MTFRLILLAAGLALSANVTMAEQAPAPLAVQTAPVDQTITTLARTMLMPEIIGVMREEGLKYGQTLEDDMFPGRGKDRWAAIVSVIYDQTRMEDGFVTALAGEFAEDSGMLPQISAFFVSAQGQQALTLEIEARRALLDPDVEEAAKVAWDEMVAAAEPRVALLKRFAEANDLIESNVMGALNANLAFYQGLAEAGALPEDMTESQMLSDVWGQEPQVRAETEDWLFPFLALAYRPMSDADLEAYIAFSETPAGQKINAALFVAFDQVFTRISHDLGSAVARQMQGEDI